MDNQEIIKLVENNLNLVHFSINRFFKSYIGKYPYLYEDFYQEGCIGLYKAALNYDSNRGKFSTVAVSYIKMEMFKALRYSEKYYRNSIESLDVSVFEDSKRTLKDIHGFYEIQFNYDVDYIRKIARKSYLKDIDKIVDWILQDKKISDIGELLNVNSTVISGRIKLFGKQVRDLDKFGEVTSNIKSIYKI
ncbi:sigma-70 family RNA polymerase sigma factor [Clostridioides difficile]|nr:RNA polymerase subunit sigma-70 [Clostridioides difficile]MDO0130429.1 RNA polymerase subunit sigma-70 [Clostridioides difficile]